MDLSNTTLGERYRLGVIIGTGGMSDVYAATDELLGRDVAVKMMRADLARDETFLERFRREAKNAAKLNHHAIVAVYDTGQTSPEHGSVPYIVMERVHGSTLREILRDSGPLPLTEAGRVMAEVCSALSFSHEAGIIHRDVKPANIMITNTGAVKVMDFGIARALSDSTSAMTQTSAVIGTAQYLSPEQARGKSADARSDIYAAGCVLYEIVTGRPPFSGESPFSVAFQHVQDAPVPPSTLPGMSLEPQQALAVDSVVLTAMAKDPLDRYDSAADMAADLQALSERRMPLASVNFTGGAVSGGTSGAHSVPAAHSGPTSGDDTATTVFPPAVTPAVLPESQVSTASPATAAQSTHSITPTTRQGDNPARPHKRRSLRNMSTTAWAIVLVVLLSIGGVVTFGVINGGIGNMRTQVYVPVVTNSPQAEAEQVLKDAGFQIKIEERPDATIDRGNAVDTVPGGNSSAPKGSKITLIISAGKEITEVPDLSGMTTEKAQRALSAAGLKLKPEVTEESSSTVKEGDIISQSPGQGSQVSKGTEVSITVSTGDEEVRVPTVSGQDLETARANLEGAGFKVEVSMVDSTEPLNRVVSVENEGTQQRKGSTVVVGVSKGNQFIMPNLRGMSYNAVAGALKSAGWTGSSIRRENVNTLDPLDIDRVVGQAPAAGSPLSKDGAITLQVTVLGVP